MLFQNKTFEIEWYARKRIKRVFDVDRKFRPLGSLFAITQQSLVMPNSDLQDRIFYPHLTPM